MNNKTFPNMENNLVSIKNFSLKYEAQCAQGLLQANGIASVVIGEDFHGIFPKGLGACPYRLMVHPQFLENAKMILQNAAPLENDEDAEIESKNKG